MSLPAVWRRHEFSLLLAILCVVVITAVLDVQHNYWEHPGASAWELLRQWSMLSLIALGAAVVIIAGGIDLSTGSVIALSGTVCAALLMWLAPDAMADPNAPMPWMAAALAIVGTLGVGFLVGSLHAWLITVVGLPPFIATLATLVGLRSLARAMCDAVTAAATGGVGSTQINVGNLQFRYLANSVIIPAILVLVLSALLWLMLSKTVLGRHLYALGGNEQAARLSGVRTDQRKWVAYCLSAMLSTLSGILYICDQAVAEPQTLGRGYELNAIAAAVVGGCSLQGGVGTVPGTMLGALFLRVVIDGVAKIIDAGADVIEGLIVGVVVVFAVTFTRAGAGHTSRRNLFDGGLGLVTVGNLTLLAGVLAALLGIKFTAGRLQLNGAWLSLWAMGATFSLLWLARCRWSSPLKRRLGVVWAVLTVVSLLGMDRAFPAVQREWAIQSVRGAGGQLSQNDDGVVIEFTGSTLTDEQLRGMTPRLHALQPLARFQLDSARVTDRSLDSLVKLPPVRELDVRGTQISSTGLIRLRRSLPGARILPE